MRSRRSVSTHATIVFVSGDMLVCRYILSQPWPLSPINPQLMIGCVAHATDEAPRNADGSVARVDFDDQELEHAAWFTRDEVIAALDRSTGAPPTGRGDEKPALGTLHAVPPPLAVAHHLIRHAVG